MTPAKTKEMLKTEVVNILKNRLKITPKIHVAILNLEFAHILDDCDLFLKCFSNFKKDECAEQTLKKELILEVQKEFEELYGVTIDNTKYRQVK